MASQPASCASRAYLIHPPRDAPFKLAMTGIETADFACELTRDSRPAEIVVASTGK
jgi:hypothetical protein